MLYFELFVSDLSLPSWKLFSTSPQPLTSSLWEFSIVPTMQVGEREFYSSRGHRQRNQEKTYMVHHDTGSTSGLDRIRSDLHTADDSSLLLTRFRSSFLLFLCVCLTLPVNSIENYCVVQPPTATSKYFKQYILNSFHGSDSIWDRKVV